VPEKYFYTDGIATYTLHTGRTTLPKMPPEPSPGETIVCLHGSGGNANLFGGLFTSLSPDHGLIAFDQPGHGRSGELDSLGSIDRMAGFTHTFLEKLGLGPVVLLGYEMGAAVALRIALDWPERVRALVLCSAGGQIDVADEALEQARQVRDGKARRAFDPRVFSRQATPEIMRNAFMEGLKTDPRARYGDLLACRDWDDRARLDAIAVPSLIIHGEDDLEAVREQAQALVASIPGARHEVVQGAGHSILLEAPGALAQATRAHLATLGGSSGATSA
jgi:pimeloyl-ACP methyl ester carboxylesterase